MKRTIYLAAGSILVATLMAACSNQPKEEKTEAPVFAQDSLVKRGEYLVATIGCGDCHTPKKMTDKGPAPDMDRFLSGYDASRPLGDYDTALAQSGRWALFNGELTAAAGPWGVSFAANLTPDVTGIGGWTLQNFRKALKEGKYKGLDNSRPLLPPMPWQNFSNLTDQDIEAIYAYLRTIKPVNNLVPQAIAPKM